MKKMWWEEVVEMAEDYKDLEWLFYNGGGVVEFAVYSNSEPLCEQSGPISEQIWAQREGLS